jgi:hypothetical protein
MGAARPSPAFAYAGGLSMDEHARHLGGLIGNLHSLEFVLRIYLSLLPGAKPFGLPHGTDIYDLPVGTEVPASAMTNYAPLVKLIRNFNIEMGRLRRPILNEQNIVGLRDALAHGRVSATAPGGTLRLIKFDDVDAKGNVRVVFNEMLTEDWFQEQTAAVIDAAQRVYQELPQSAKS